MVGKQNPLRYSVIKSFLHDAVDTCPEMCRTFLTIPTDGDSEADIALMFAKVRDAAKIQDLADAKAKTRLVKQAQQFPTEIPQETMLESYCNKLDPSLRVPGHIYSRWVQKSKTRSCSIY